MGNIPTEKPDEAALPTRLSQQPFACLDKIAGYNAANSESHCELIIELKNHGKTSEASS
jgi:hypothetical protein